MNWFGKLFEKKKKGYNNNCNYKLLIIDDKAEHLHDILGITEKRAEEITEVCLTAYNKHNQLHSCLEEVVNHCQHTNEVVFATLVTHRVIERSMMKDHVMDMLKNMFGHE